MTIATRFRRVFRACVPGWLGGGPESGVVPTWMGGDGGPQSESEGRRVLHTLGVMKDAMTQRSRLGLLYRYPQYAVTSALNVIGRDRRMTRGLGESDEAWARRLVRWRYPRGHRVRGNPFAMLTQIRAYLNGPVKVRTVDRRGNWYEVSEDGTESYYWNLANWAWGAFTGPDWSRFWVIIYNPAPSEVGDPPQRWTKRKFGQGAKFGTGKFGGTWTTADVSSIETIVREWKPAGMMQETVLIAFDDGDDLFNPADPSAPTADWERYSIYDAGVRVPVREPDAKYWYVRPE